MPFGQPPPHRQRRPSFEDLVSAGERCWGISRPRAFAVLRLIKLSSRRKKRAFDRRLGGQSHLRADEIFTPENKEPGENVCKKRLALRDSGHIQKWRCWRENLPKREPWMRKELAIRATIFPAKKPNCPAGPCAQRLKAIRSTGGPGLNFSARAGKRGSLRSS
jgi:hypothetical protein